MAFREDISPTETKFVRTASDANPARRDRYLLGPFIDFICLGGGSLLILPLIFVLPLEQYQAPIGHAFLFVAFVLNYPHFANSYQIFYRNFHRKAFSKDYQTALRARYIVAGIVVPAALAWFFTSSVLNDDVRTLGLAVNLMALLVGWHYVKQGYGVLMVDAVFKRQIFRDTDKRILRINAYVVWFLSWLYGNTAVSQQELLDLQYYTFETPTSVLAVLGAVAAVTSAMTAWMLARRWRENGRSLPVNGVCAYIASLYFWFLFFSWDIDPIWLIVVPAMHSLQYLVVVWRYQLGYEKDRVNADRPLFSFLPQSLIGRRYHLNLALFIALGVILGALGFWVVPILLQALVSYDTDIFGTTLFMFIFFIFINVHHYFLDNVMWRRENPDMRRYLFS